MALPTLPDCQQSLRGSNLSQGRQAWEAARRITPDVEEARGNNSGERAGSFVFPKNLFPAEEDATGVPGSVTRQRGRGSGRFGSMDRWTGAVPTDEGSLKMLTRMGWTCIAFWAWLSLGTPLAAAEPKLELVLQTGHTDLIHSVAWSPDGKRVLTGSYDNTAILWEAATGRKLRTFAGHTDRVTSVAIGADGKTVLTGSEDKTAILWDVGTGKKLRTFAGHGGGITSVTVSDNGEMVLTGSRDKTAILWTAATGKKAHSFERHTEAVNSVALGTDGKSVLTGSDDGTACLWDAATGKRLRTLAEDLGHVWSVALSGDGKTALIVPYNTAAFLWDVKTGQKLRTFAGHANNTTSGALSGNGKTVLTGSIDHTAILWDAATGEKLRTFAGHNDAIFGVALSSDGKRVLTGSVDRTAMLWDATTGLSVRTLAGQTDLVFSVARSDDGKTILTGVSDRRGLLGPNARIPILWDATIGQPLRTLGRRNDRTVSVALSGDGRTVLTGSSFQTVILWEAATGKELRTFTGHTGSIDTVALSRDGNVALTLSSDTTAILWNAATGEKLQTTTGLGPPWATSVALRADGKTVLTAYGDKGALFGATDPAAILWEIGTGRKLATFTGHAGTQSSVALSTDGQTVLTGSSDKKAILWDAATGRKLHTLDGHDSAVTSVALSANGQMVLTGSSDKTAILWDAMTGRKTRSLEGHTAAVSSVTLGGDGKITLTGSLDGTVRLWETATGAELCCLISIEAGQEWLVVTPEGLFDGSVNAPRFVSYRVAGTLDFVPLDHFLNRYRTPGLLTKIMNGERPKPKVDVGKALPPKVRLVSPASALEIKDGKLEVKAEADSVGDYPVTSLLLHLDGRPYQGQQGLFRVANPKLGRVLASWSVDLELGRHTLRVLADTQLVQGVASEEVEVRYVGGAAAPVELPTLYVLAVGISKYTDDKLALDYAAADARAVATAYQTHSKKLFRKVEPKVLTDREATREAIADGLEWLRTSTTQRDYAVFFFAGHGEKDGTGTLYFLPVEADVKRLAATGIDQALLKRQLVNLPGKVTAILDACHAGRIGLAASGAGTASMLGRSAAGLTDDLLRELMAAENGLVVLSSATGNELARESNAHKHGIFTQALLEGLAGQEIAVQDGKETRKLRAQPDRDGAIFFHQLESFLHERVKDLSKGQQHAIVYKPDGMRSFPVSKP
jgi:WD40 repeat protein